MDNLITVVSLQGQAWAVAQDGSRRELKVGDIVAANEMVVTADGAQIDLQFANNQVLTLIGEQEIPVQVLQDANSTEISQPLSPINAPTPSIITTGRSGGDGYGGAAGGSGGVLKEGHGFVQLVRIAEIIEADGFTHLTVARIQEIIKPLGMILPERDFDNDLWKAHSSYGEQTNGSELKLSISIDMIAEADIIHAATTQQNMTLTGTVGGDVKPGDTVTVTVNGKTYEATVNPDGRTWNVDVPGSELLQDKTVNASVTTKTPTGQTVTAYTELPQDVDAPLPKVTVELNGAGPDGIYNESEIVNGKVPATVTLDKDTVKVGDILVVKTPNGDILLNRPVTTDDINNGVPVLVPVVPNQSTVIVEAIITDPAGNSGNGRDEKPVDNLPPDVTGALEPRSDADADDILLDLSKEFNDVVGGKDLTYVANGLPKGLEIDPETGIVSGTIDSSASQNGNIGHPTDGQYKVVITVTDSTGQSSNKDFVWTIDNPPPVAIDDSNSTLEDIPLIVSKENGVLGNDYDPDGDKPLQVIEFEVVGKTYLAGETAKIPSVGELTLNTDGSYTFNPVSGFNGSVPTVDYTIFDGEGGTASAELNIKVIPVIDVPVTPPTPIPVVAITLTSTPKVTEGGKIIVTASVEKTVEGSPLSVVLNTGETIVIPVGKSSASIEVDSRSDDAYKQGETEKTFKVEQAFGGNGQINNSSVGSTTKTTIIDNTDTTSISLTASPDLPESGGLLTYTVTLGSAVRAGDEPVTVTFKDLNGTSQTITISSGSTGTQLVTIPSSLFEDVYAEAPADVTIATDVTVAGGKDFEALGVPSVGTIEITDTIDPVILTLDDVTVLEDSGTAQIQASLDHAPQTELIVTLSNGATITFDTTYVPGSKVTSTAFAINNGEDPYIDSSSFVLSVTATDGGNFENLVITDTATVTVNDTLTPVVAELSVNETAVNEGAADLLYTVTLRDVNGDPVITNNDVTVETTLGTVTIVAGNSSGTLSVPVQGDDVYNDGETVTNAITILVESNAGAAGSFEALSFKPDAVSTVVSDTIDTTSISLTASPDLPESGGLLTYTVTLGSAVRAGDEPVTVTFKDLNDDVQSITVNAGDTTGTLAVSIPPSLFEDVYAEAPADVTIATDVTVAGGKDFEALGVPTVGTIEITDTIDPVILTLDDVTVLEGTGTAQIQASLDHAPQTELIVTLSNGATITFDTTYVPGSKVTSTAFAINNGEDPYIDSSSFVLSVSTTDGGNFENLITTDTATVTVNDTLTPVVAELSVNETAVNEGAAPLVYTVTLRDVNGDPVITNNDVTVETTLGTVTIVAGNSSGTLSVPVQGDDVYNDGETVTNAITSLVESNAGAPGSFEALSFKPDAVETVVSDTIDITSISLTASPDLPESGGLLTYTVTLGSAVRAGDEPVTVTFKDLNGDVQSITVNAGDTTGTLAVTIPPSLFEDVYAEAPADVTIATDVTVAGGKDFEALGVPTVGTIEITDTIDPVILTLDDVTVLEGTGTAQIQASLDHAPQTELTVTLSNGATLTFDTSYVPGSKVTSTAFAINNAEDVYIDASSFVVSVTATDGGNFENLITTDTATVTVNDTLTPVIAELSVNETAVNEGAADLLYTVTLRDVNGDPVITNNDVTVETTLGTVTIFAGNSSGTLNVPVQGDDVYNDGETVTNAITSLVESNAGAAGSFEALSFKPDAVETVVSDTIDTTSISLTASPDLPESGGLLTYTVTLASAVRAGDEPVTVTFKDLNGDVQNITVNAGDTTGTLAVTIPPSLFEDVYAEAPADVTIATDVTVAGGKDFEALGVPTVGTIEITDTIDPVILTLDDVTVLEGTGTAQIQASLDHAPQTELTVTLSNGATITFDTTYVPGSTVTSTPFDIDNGEDVYIDASSFVVSVTATDGGNFENLITTDTATVTVNDTLTPVIAELSVNETAVNEGAADLLYTVTLRDVNGDPVITNNDVTVETTLGTVTIVAGNSSGTLNVPVQGDDVYNDGETVTNAITSLVESNAGAAGSFEALSFKPDAVETVVSDTIDTTSISLTASPDLPESGGLLTYTVTLASAVRAGDEPVTVTFKDLNGDVQNITVNAGDTTGTLAVTIPPSLFEDVYAEAPADVTIATDVTVAGGKDFEALGVPSVGTIEITDTIDPVILTLDDVTVLEGTGTAQIQASLDHVPQTELTVTLSNGATLTFDTSYVPGSKVTSTAFAINNGEDPYIDPSSFVLSVTATDGGNFENLVITDTATVTVNDTLTPVVAELSVNETAVNEGAAPLVYTVTLRDVNGDPVITNNDVTVETTLGTVTIVAGNSSGTLNVPVQGDDVYNDGETVTNAITSLVENNAGAAGSFEALSFKPDAVNTVVSDTIDTTSISLTASPDLPESGGLLTYTVTLGSAVRAGDEPVTVTFKDLNGALQTITISSGSTGTQLVTIPSSLFEDVYAEAPADVTIATDVTVAGGKDFEALGVPTVGTIEITDTIDPVILTLDDVTVLEGTGTAQIQASLDHVPQTELTVTLSNGATLTFDTSYVPGSKVTSTAFAINNGEDPYIDPSSFVLSVTATDGGNFENLVITDTATVTVNDTLTPVVAELSVNETAVNEGAAPLVYTVTLRDVNGDPVITNNDVTVETTLGTVTIVAGNSSGTLNVPVQGDDVYNDGETVTNAITSLVESNAGAAGSFEALSFKPDAVNTVVSDTIDTTSISLTASPDLPESGGLLTYTVTLGSAVRAGDEPVTVTFKDLNGDVQSITVNAGDTTGTLAVTIPPSLFEDVYAEAPADVTIATDITVAGGKDFEALGVPTVGTIEITDTIDPVYAQITVDQASVLEGGTLKYTVSLVDANGQPVEVAAGKTVDVQLNWSGAAANLGDVDSLPTSITIGAGQSSATFDVVTTIDTVTEYSETLTATISGLVDNGTVKFEDLRVGSANVATSNILDAPTITAVDDNGSTIDGQITVYEKGLTDVADTSETASGILRVTAPSGLDSISIDGTTITLLQLQNLTGVPQPIIITGHGILTLTGMTPETLNGQEIAWDVSYTYTLTDPQTHPDADGKNSLLENIVLGVIAKPIDGIGPDISAAGTLGVLVIDDVPTANDDSIDVIADSFVATGNVLTNSDPLGTDRQGADTAKVTKVTAGGADVVVPETGTVPVVGVHGTLTIQADGTYTYQRADNVKSGSVDEFTYTLTDADGDIDTATLTVTVKDGTPTLTIPAVGDATTTVYESGLDDGTSIDKTLKTATGTIDFFTNDGVPSITLAGQTLTLTDTSIAGADGLTARYEHDPATGLGKIHYTYTLPETVIDTAGDTSKTFAVTVSDGDTTPDSVTGNLVIKVVNDAPLVSGAATIPTIEVDETALATSNTGEFAAAFNVNYGADGQAATGALVYSLEIDSAIATGMTDIATGKAIDLFMNGTSVEGRVTGTTDVAFTVSVDANGQVTLTQTRAFKHPDTSNPDDAVSLPKGALSLKATVTDGDNDKASASISLGDKLSFKDDAPTIAVDDTKLGSLLVDESNWALGQVSATNPSFIQGVFTVNYGADGSAGTTYALSVKTQGIDSGLIDTATGGKILLSVSGNNIVGKVGGDVAFIISMNSGTGAVTLTQKRPIQHPDKDDHDDVVSLAAGILFVTATATDGDGDAVNSTAVDVGGRFTFKDDGPSITPATGDTEVDEKGLASGSAPQAALLTATGNLNVKFGADKAGDVVFTDTASGSTTAALTALNLASQGTALVYVVSNNGHTLTASAGGNPVFTVVITNPKGIDGQSGYKFTLQGPLDHVDGASAIDIILGFTNIVVTDGDGDSVKTQFNVKVVDDAPVMSKSIIINEDLIGSTGENTFNANADATQSNTSIDAGAMPAHGTATVNSNGTITYVPDSNYSGADTFTYTTTVNGVSKTFTVNVTVNPISDKPGLPNDNLGATDPIGDTSFVLATPEDTAIVLGLKQPTITDHTDQSIGIEGDNPERLGAITLSLSGVGATAGAKLVTGGKELDLINGKVTIVITDTSGSALAKAGYHETNVPVKNEGAGVYYLTEAEYQALTIDPAADRHENITVTVSVDSYEVDNSDSKLAGVDGAKSTQVITVDVLAVTDAIGIKVQQGTAQAGVTVVISGSDKVADITFDEDTSFNLTNILNPDAFKDLDGSETRYLGIDGLPNGTIIKVGGTSYEVGKLSMPTVELNGKFIPAVTILGTETGLPVITITPPKDFSGDLNGIKVVLAAKDSDSDSTNAAPVQLTDTVMINLHIKPVAGDIKIDGVTGVEDTAIHFLSKVNVTDNTNAAGTLGEIITKVSFKLSAGWTTANAGETWTNTAGQVWTLTEPTGVYAPSIGYSISFVSGEYVITFDPGSVLTREEREEVLSQFTLTTPAHSSKDVVLNVTVTSKDSSSVSGVVVSDEADVSGLLNITVTPAPERADSSTNDGFTNPADFDVKLNPNHIYNTSGKEDEYLTLGEEGIFKLSAGWSNEDGKWVDDGSGNWVNNTDNGRSEDTYALLTPYQVTDNNIQLNGTGATLIGSTFQYTDANGVQTVTFDGTAVKIPMQYLDTVKFKGPENYKGVLKIKVQAGTVDYDEDTNAATDMAISGEAWLTNIIIMPQADQVTLKVEGRITALEDTPKTLDILPTSSDKTETFNITIAGIPTGASIEYKGVIYTENTASGSGITVTPVAGGFTLAIEGFNVGSQPILTPPKDSNIAITLNITAVSVDTLIYIDANGDEQVSTHTATGSLIQSLPINITVTGVPDEPVLELDQNQSYNEDAGNQTSGQLEVTLSDLIKKLESGETGINNAGPDGSEKITLRISDLPEGFSLKGAGATLGGSGTSRVWVVTEADLASVKIVVPLHYSGEVIFTAQPVVTESDNPSEVFFIKENIKFTVTPVPEATLSITSDLQEDTIGTLQLNPISADSDEYISAVRISEATVNAAGITLYDVNNQPLTASGGFYIVQNTGTTGAPVVKVKGPANFSGSKKLDIEYKVTDFTDDKTSSVQSDWQAAIVHTLNFGPVTDKIELKLGNIDGGSTVGTVTSTTDVGSVKVGLEITQKPDANAGNTPDADGSEMFIHVVISGVPNGVSVKDAVETSANEWLLIVNGRNFTDATLTQDLEFVVSRFATTFEQPITITTYTKDTNASVFETDSVTWTLKHTSATGPDPVELPLIDLIAENVQQTEDTAFKLGDVVIGTITAGAQTGNGEFQITVTVRTTPDDKTVFDGMTRTVVKEGSEQVALWTKTVGGVTKADAQTQLESLLNSINVEAPKDANSNNITGGLFNLDVNVSVHADGISRDAQAKPALPITPVTDDVAITVSNTVVNEGQDIALNISLNSKDDADGVLNASGAGWTVVGNQVFIHIANGSLEGELFVNGVKDLGSATAPTGAPVLGGGKYYQVAVTDLDKLVFTPDSAQPFQIGQLNVSVWAKHTENLSGNTVVSNGTGSLTIQQSNNGYKADISAIGTEVQLSGDTTAAVQLDFGAGSGVIDPAESVNSAFITGLPSGFTVYIGVDAASAQQANNAGEQTWSIPVTGGVLPAYIAILPPANWSGSLDNLKLTVLSGHTNLAPTPTEFDVSFAVTPVANGIELNPTLSFGDAGQKISLNLNASMKDPSVASGALGDAHTERTELTLSGFPDGEKVMFYVDGSAGGGNLDGRVTKDGSGKYVISGLTQAELDSLKFVHGVTSGKQEINISAHTYEIDTSGNQVGANSTVSTGKMDINISPTIATSGSDLFLWAGQAINGLGGEDTVQLRFGDDLGSTDFGKLKNIEVIDMQGASSGANSITSLTVADVFNMTDGNNLLKVLGDAEDTISLSGWGSSARGTDTTTYTATYSGETVKLEVSNLVID